ncbi:GntR family transcriptional regulator [Bacillus sp. ISL-40]|uniref:GntR family transcriptional regulator n=1 Tax=unclassified Bacillus (in: firmicutes) TaxID=185979 RepID=UPI001BEC0591|nr:MULTISPECIES: GntR family transcriptional regulator [unclassified Bacillus (in: firmicutes)]MBT2700774.1 GntR family transcriptional regulator [Bacillus sp. ISL-40]MBT2742680.1 GntR family transcriptional regulator [Bacillus sp. ISL-77]
MEKDMIKPIKRLSFRDEVYQTLKRSIITLELQPEERLNDKELAEKFGISRTPVREALKRLEDEGLVESLPGSSTRVAPLKLEEAKHAFTVVAALHALAARLANPLLKETDIEELEFSNKTLRVAIEKGDVIKAIEADRAFHKVFLDAAANPEIALALERIIPKIQRLEISQFISLKGLKSVEQHDQIISSCKNQEHERVVRLVEENWLSLGELLTHQTEPR